MSTRLTHVTPFTRVVLAAISLALATTPFAAAAEAAGARPFTPSKIIELADGIRYTRGSMRTSGGRLQSIRVATIDASQPEARLRSMLSNDVVLRKERPSRLARRKSRPGRRAMVATNGDASVFGREDAYAAPASMHISNGELMLMGTCVRPTVGIDSSGRARIDEVRVRIEARRIGQQATKLVNRVNTHRDDHLVVLFTRRFGSSTKTARGGVEVVLELANKLRPSDVQVAKVIKVRRGGGDTRLRPGQAVLSVKGTQGRWVKELRRGHRLQLKSMVVRRVDDRCGGKVQVVPGWDDIVEAMGGNHFTARNGQVKAPSRSRWAKSVERHPRTNVGVTPDGRVLMVTIDGRQPGYSVGVTLAEAGKLMLSLGARHAFNLDGGGSTVMARRSLKSGEFRVDNRPSDGHERRHSQALIAFDTTAAP